VRERAKEPVLEESPPPSLSLEEKAAFWSDLGEPRRAVKRRAPEPPAYIEEEVRAPVDAPEQAAVPPAVAEAAVSVSAPEEAFGEALIPTDEALMKDEYAPRLRRRAAKKERKKAAGIPVALQVPEDYAGEVTIKPSYVKAVFFGLLTGILLAGAYAGFEWWRHSGRWIFGWIIGVAVGIVVVLASGRHFSWKLGIVSAVISWLSLCLGQIAFSILDVRFNSLLPLKLPFMDLLNHAVRELGKAFGSLWLVMFLITGLVAFVLSFRPWPVKLQISEPPQAGRMARPSSKSLR
jgi:hypothetical protein